MSDYIYALDEAGGLIPGSTLRYAYSGAGVATLIDQAGKGYRAPLAEVEALAALSVRPEEQAQAAEFEASESTPVDLHVKEGVDVEAAISYSDALRPALEDEIAEARVLLKRGPGRPKK